MAGRSVRDRRDVLDTLGVVSRMAWMRMRLQQGLPGFELAPCSWSRMWMSQAPSTSSAASQRRALSPTAPGGDLQSTSSERAQGELSALPMRVHKPPSRLKSQARAIWMRSRGAPPPWRRRRWRLPDCRRTTSTCAINSGTLQAQLLDAEAVRSGSCASSRTGSSPNGIGAPIAKRPEEVARQFRLGDPVSRRSILEAACAGRLTPARRACRLATSP